MKVEDIFNEYGWQYIDDRKQSTVEVLSFIDIINEEDDNNEN